MENLFKLTTLLCPGGGSQAVIHTMPYCAGTGVNVPQPVFTHQVTASRPPWAKDREPCNWFLLALSVPPVPHPRTHPTGSHPSEKQSLRKSRQGELCWEGRPGSRSIHVPDGSTIVFLWMKGICREWILRARTQTRTFTQLLQLLYHCVSTSMPFFSKTESSLRPGTVAFSLSQCLTRQVAG